MLKITGWLCMLSLLVCFGSGCETYALRGKVVDGGVSAVMLVDKNDPRLDADGISGATIEATIDPRSLSRQRMPTVSSEADGGISLPVNVTGAGLLEYEAMVVVRYPQMAPAVRFMPLPGSDKRLLITLAPGEDDLNLMRTDIIEETRQLGQQFSR